MIAVYYQTKLVGVFSSKDIALETVDVLAHRHGVISDEFYYEGIELDALFNKRVIDNLDPYFVKIDENARSANLSARFDSHEYIYHFQDGHHEGILFAESAEGAIHKAINFINSRKTIEWREF